MLLYAKEFEKNERERNESLNWQKYDGTCIQKNNEADVHLQFFYFFFVVGGGYIAGCTNVYESAREWEREKKREKT